MNKDVEMRYIGSKKLLLSEIKEMLDKHLFGGEEIFLDLFAGTNVVGNFFKPYFTIYSNDTLYFNYIKAKTVIENNSYLHFNALKKIGINNPLEYLQQLEGMSGYYTNNYSPAGNSMYLTQENARKIDSIREQIEKWKAEKLLLNEYEYFYLLNCLIEAIPYVSNITGTYGAFLKHWDKRALNPLTLTEETIIFNNYRKNKAFHQDANELVKQIKADIVYIDTPYNSRQYASNYHLLENVALHHKPELKGVTKIFDWQSLKSDYSTKTRAANAMENLIANIDSTHIILSYNNEGIISESELYSLLLKYAYDNQVDVKRIPYRKYQSKQKSKQKELYELLFYIQRKPTPNKFLNKPKHKPTVINQREYIKSPLNYIGGKYRLLKQIIPLFPKEIDTFVDLFSGGANVGINVPAHRYIFNDMNYRINEMFRYFQSHDPIELVEKIEKRIKEYQLSKTNEAGFLAFRKQYNENPNPLDLYILSSYSYNYQFRFNNLMEFNNPFGRNRSHFSENMKKNLLNFITRLQSLKATFSDKLLIDFDISKLSKNDFVYLDPPYLITTGSYNDGNRGFTNWGEKQEAEMYQVMRELNHRGIKFALSNVLKHKGKHNTMLEDFIKEEQLHLTILNYHYKNSSYNTIKEDSVEVLITNYDPKTVKA
ncbi:Dam family site-specific DNA-(adenine-N6)-methyltransferase [Streptococcus pantholopis]|uniref:Site-specific DNA-methyltransferase (adenine-specific) n=1 Tax=Streptococcus pantholopis TaxID=1811193 RepID=A0A172Q522_9STRE|nr:Dam family site-specific DNA-(adenine-N6)-methyltransferase [Streptococcus pantholopis]AND78548.1 DNA adenine methylase [Streptococcus pantholopis]